MISRHPHSVSRHPSHPGDKREKQAAAIGHPALIAVTLLGWAGFLFPSPIDAAVAGVPSSARFFSKTVRAIEQRLETIREELPALPDIPQGPGGGSLGFHAKYRAAEQRQQQVWVTIDLERDRPIEAIVLIPANVVHGAGESRGYGFPTGFRVEVSSSADFTEAATEVIADHGTEALLQPSPAVVLETKSCHGRYVRVTATDLWVMEESNRAVFALAELLVFSDGRNVAPGKPVTALDSIEGKPLWSVDNLTDGQSGLGHAITKERSTTNGYHSHIEDSPTRAKWVQVDLGSKIRIDEIRVFPARPIDWAESHGFGFPEHFRIEAADHQAFADPTVLLDHSTVSFPNPGDNPIIIPSDTLQARYVRFTATRLWKREADYVFALAEIQVFSEGENAALGSPVQASDTLEMGFWSKEYLVDGYDSHHRLANDELAWLRGMARKQSLLNETRELEAALVDEVGRVTSLLVWLASAFVIAIAALAGITIFRGRTLRQRATDRIRERIASDLHDEIGSNLGSISLLSELGGAEEEMSEINRIARETAESMHDIAWVIRSGYDTLQDLILRMRETAATMLRQIDHTFTVSPPDSPNQKISLDLKRHTLLFFKEALHNVLQHATASKVTITMDITPNHFALRIRDDGCGFDPQAAAVKASGGLKNLVKRARSLNGEATIESSPGNGSHIALEADISS